MEKIPWSENGETPPPAPETSKQTEKCPQAPATHTATELSLQDSGDRTGQELFLPCALRRGRGSAICIICIPVLDGTGACVVWPGMPAWVAGLAFACADLIRHNSRLGCTISARRVWGYASGPAVVPVWPSARESSQRRAVR